MTTGSRISDPEATVLMPVWNGEKYIRDAVESILCQTRGDYEFIIIDDGSTDGSAGIVSSFTDARIRFLRHEHHAGLAQRLNEGLDMARGAFVARMDCDDISLPARLEKQLHLLRSSPETGVCGTWVQTIGSTHATVWQYPVGHDAIKAGMIFGPALAHPTVMLRSDTLRRHRLRYSTDCEAAQDYEFWMRCIRHTRFANIPEVLLRYRLHEQQRGKTHKGRQIDTLHRVWDGLFDSLGAQPGEAERTVHEALALWRFEPGPEFLHRATAWLEKLCRCNRQSGMFAEPVFSQVLAGRWLELLRHSTGTGALKAFVRSPLRGCLRLGRRQKLAFALRCIVKRHG